MINSITLQCRAGRDLEHIKTENGRVYFCEVFALHERYIPPSDENPNEERSVIIPLYIKFRKKTAKLASMTISKGTPFVVSGQLDYYKDEKTNVEWFSIIAYDLAIGAMKPKDNTLTDEPVSSEPGHL